MQDLEKVVEIIAKEYRDDVYLDQLNLREMELRAPSLKGKWSEMRWRHRAKLFNVKQTRDDMVNPNMVRMVREKKETEGHSMTLKSAELLIKNSSKYKELNGKVERLEIICGFLESCEKNMQSIGFDIKNLVDTIKIDEMG